MGERGGVFIIQSILFSLIIYSVLCFGVLVVFKKSTYTKERSLHKTKSLVHFFYWNATYSFNALNVLFSVIVNLENLTGLIWPSIFYSIWTNIEWSHGCNLQSKKSYKRTVLFFLHLSEYLFNVKSYNMFSLLSLWQVIDINLHIVGLTSILRKSLQIFFLSKKKFDIDRNDQIEWETKPNNGIVWRDF